LVYTWYILGIYLVYAWCLALDCHHYGKLDENHF
jgi:hypothetical protein